MVDICRTIWVEKEVQNTCASCAVVAAEADVVDLAAGDSHDDPGSNTYCVIIEGSGILALEWAPER